MSANPPFDITAVEHAFLEFDLHPPAKPTQAQERDALAQAEAEEGPLEKGKGLCMPELVASLTEALSDPAYNADSPADIERVRRLMEAYDASSGDWRRFALFDESKHYTRNLVATDNKTFTLMMLCWNPRRGSPIHAHESANCWARMVDGVCRESRYAWPTDEAAPLQLTSVGDAGAGAVVFIRDDVGLHRIENPTDAPAVSLHLYSPPYDKCSVFLNPQQGRASNVNVTFYSENGVKNEYQ